MSDNKANTTGGEKILLITNKSTFSDSIVDTLNKLGYVSAQENTGDAGVKRVFDTLPHLVIVDVGLPNMEGYKAIDSICSEKMLSKIPIFLMSTNGMPIDMKSIKQNAITEYIMLLHSEIDPVIEKINAHFGKAPAPVTLPGEAKKILWVEDDKLIGTILSKKLISSGFDLTHAKSGDEAMTILSSNAKFDAALLDLILPGIGGFDILQKIRNTPETKNMPVMILSNISKASDIERAKILGAQKFIVKAAASLDKIVEDVRELCGIPKSG